jgi:O-antigen/teichoic acid export membrane protein
VTVPSIPPQPPAEDVAVGGMRARSRDGPHRRAFSISMPADPLFRSAYALILSTLATGVLGIAYWVVAARSYPPRALGEASAAISAMLMLSNFAQLNLFYGLTRFVPRAGRRTSALVGSAYLVSGATALLLATAFVLLAPVVAPGFTFLRSGWPAASAFVVAVAVWGVFALQDGVLTALRQAPWVPVENALFGVVKLVLLVAFARVFVDGGIFASWTIPVLLAIVPVNLLVFRRLIPQHRRLHGNGEGFRLREITRFVAVDYTSSLFLQSYTTALPLIIVAMLGARANASFYVAYAFVAALDLVSANLATSLVVEGSHAERRLSEYTRRVLRRSTALLVPAIGLLILVSPYLPRVLGDAYEHDTPTVLRLLVLGSLPRMLNTVFMSAQRVERRVARVVAVQAATSLAIVSLTLMLAPRLGVEGVAVAWACGHLAVASALLPWLWRTLR